MFVSRWQKAEISSRRGLSMVIFRTEHNVPDLHHTQWLMTIYFPRHSSHSLFSLFHNFMLSSALPLSALHANSLFLACLPFALSRCHTDHFKYIQWSFQDISDSTDPGKLSLVWPVRLTAFMLMFRSQRLHAGRFSTLLGVLFLFQWKHVMILLDAMSHRLN